MRRTTPRDGMKNGAILDIKTIQTRPESRKGHPTMILKNVETRSDLIAKGSFGRSCNQNHPGLFDEVTNVRTGPQL
jgi:hypothetical protein